jgi:hypothetical protein
MKTLIATIAPVMLTPAAAQSWGRGGAYVGASPALGYRDGRGSKTYTPFFREPCGLPP